MNQSLHLMKTSGKIDQWQTTKRLSKSNWSEVYQARPISPLENGSHADNPGDYVVKIPNHETFDVSRKMLKREMQIAQAIMHPNLITVLDGKLDCELPYTVQPLLVGSTLRALIDMGAKMSLPFALWIGRQIAEAIQVLHHAGLIHSDISPRNALVDAQGHVTLIDLGMARLVTQTEPTQIIAGTEEYIAPELKEDQGQFCKAIDIFSLGVVLSELVSGQVPKRTELKIAGITIKTDTVSNISSKHETSGGVKKLLSNMVEPKAKIDPRSMKSSTIS